MLELATRYRVPIVEDDTYRELALTTTSPPSLFDLDEAHAVVIRINTFSKMLAPGLRLGWISAVRPIVEQLALLRQQSDPYTQNLSQLVVCELIEKGFVFDPVILPHSGPNIGGAADALVTAFAQGNPGKQRAALRDPGRWDVSVVPACAAGVSAQRAGVRAARGSDGRHRRAVLR